MNLLNDFVDANLLVYAHVSSFQQHENARSCLDSELNGNSPVGLPWHSLLAFLRIVTNPRVFQKPETMSDACNEVEEWLDMQANLAPDAHLASLAIEHGLILCSTDGDFARFRNLRWQDPLSKE